jgi:hypothetical protein
MSGNDEPHWAADLATGGETLRRQVQPIVQAVQQFVRDAHQAKTSGGHALPFVQRAALAVDAAIRELLPAGEPGTAVAAVELSGCGTLTGPRLGPAVVLSGVGAMTVGGSFALPSIRFVAGADVANASDDAAVVAQVQRSALAVLSYGQLLVLVLLWLTVLVIPAAVWRTDVSPGTAVMVDAYDAILAELAVKVTFSIVDNSRCE